MHIFELYNNLYSELFQHDMQVCILPVWDVDAGENFEYGGLSVWV